MKRQQIDISDFTDDELRKELEGREIVSTKPELIYIGNSDDGFMFKLQSLCQSYIDSLAGGEYFKDAEHHIFEAAITVFYGADVWEWINQRIE